MKQTGNKTAEHAAEARRIYERARAELSREPSPIQADGEALARRTLRKYIDYVCECGHSTFINERLRPDVFTADEWDLLCELQRTAE